MFAGSHCCVDFLWSLLCLVFGTELCIFQFVSAGFVLDLLRCCPESVYVALSSVLSRSTAEL